MQYVEGRAWGDLRVGDSASSNRVISEQDIILFATIAGRLISGQADGAGDQAAQGTWGAVLISEVLTNQLPGPGVVHLDQTLSFRGPARIGDTVTTTVTLREKGPDRRVTLDCECRNQNDEVLVVGQADVIAPKTAVRRPRAAALDIQLLRRGAPYGGALDGARGLPALRTAVVHPVDAASLSGALDAAKLGLIDPVLVGPRAKIEAAALAAGVDLTGVEIVDTPHSHAAAARAVEQVRSGAVEALMKGSLHTDELMGAVMKADIGLRTGRRVSHVFALDVPSYPKPLLITDAAINIYPTLEDKRDIVQNAIDLCQAMGVATPKVAILSAVETVNPKILSTVEAAALCKMADRGQITGGLLDGPLAFDNAISKAAAQAKSIVSDVAGDADILLAPDLESGNMIAKQLIYLADAEAAGLVLGARVPIMLTSRSDSSQARTASCALAQVFARARDNKGARP